MKSDSFQRVVLFLISPLLLLASGCGTMEALYEKVSTPAIKIASSVKPDRSGLRKKVLILPFLNQAGLPEKKLQELTSTFVGFLEKDDRIVLEKSEEPIPTTSKERSPRFGIVIDADAAKRAEEMGLNVLLTVVVNPYELRFKRTGIWPLRKVRREVEVSMVVNAVDLTNGTLFLTQLESEKMDFATEEVDEGEERKLEMPTIDDKTFTKLWTRILERQASTLRTGLRDHPWTGRVLSADGRGIILSAGRNVGLSTGKVFEVYGKGESVRTASGRSIYLLGPKIGEIQAAEIMEDSASAVPVTEAAYKAGQVIRIKN